MLKQLNFTIWDQKQQDDDNNTYQSFMKENIKAIEKALQNE